MKKQTFEYNYINNDDPKSLDEIEINNYSSDDSFFVAVKEENNNHSAGIFIPKSEIPKIIKVLEGIKND